MTLIVERARLNQHQTLEQTASLRSMSSDIRCLGLGNFQMRDPARYDTGARCWLVRTFSKCLEGT